MMLHVQSPPLSWIVAPFDIVKDIGPGVGSCPIMLSIHAFTFKDSEEALGGGVVRAAPHCTHAADHLVRFENRWYSCEETISKAQSKPGYKTCLLNRHALTEYPGNSAICSVVFLLAQPGSCGLSPTGLVVFQLHLPRVPMISRSRARPASVQSTALP